MDEQGGLRIVDVSIPTAPLLVGVIYEPVDISDIAVANGFAYVTTSGWGISIIDVSNPTLPVSAGFVNDPLVSSSTSVAAADTLLFYGRWNGGLHVVDVSNPAAPLEIALLTTVHTISDMVAADGLVYAAADSGLYVIDVSNPATPEVIGHCAFPNVHWKLSLQGSRVFLASSQYGLRVVDVSNPTQPVLVGFYHAPSGLYDLAVQDSVIYLAGGDHVDIYGFTSPVSVPRRNDKVVPRELKLSAYPNPFNPATTMSIDVPRGQREVTLTVFDLLGREVLRERLSAASGIITYHFDASALPSGIYMARAQSGEYHITTKLVLLK
jgi:hypothetical protein